MAPVIFKRTTKAERRPKKIITKDLLFHNKPPEDEELSPLEMEKKFVVCKSPPTTTEDSKTPETVDSMIMTFSDDSFDSNDDDDDNVFGDSGGGGGDTSYCQFDTNWWEVPTPERNNTTTNRWKEVHMTPFSKLALESTSRRLPLSPLDMNTKIQPLSDHHDGSSINPIKLNMKDKNSFSSSRRNNHQDSAKTYVAGNRKQPAFSQAIEDFDSSTNNNNNVKSPAEIKDDLDVFWRRNTKSATTTTAVAAVRQPYISPFSKSTLARNAEGKHTMPPTYSSSKDKSLQSQSSQQWVQFTPVKGFDNKKLEKTLTTPFSKRTNRRGSPLLSPLDCDAFCLTPAATQQQQEETPEPKNLFDLSLEEDEGVIEIKIKKKKDGEDTDTVVSGLTKIVEGDDDNDHDGPGDLDELAIDGLHSFDIWNAKDIDDDDSNDDDEGGRTDTLTSSCDIWGMVVKEVEEDSFDAGDGLLSNFLHNFMVSTPPQKQKRGSSWCGGENTESE